MPKRTDLKKILVIGAGPIVIGQACEFDYSGTQACKALRAEGYEVVLLNSNPATIMTDPGTADRTYVEPVTPEVLEAIIERERPDALLATMGGQTALNTAVAAAESGALERFGVEMIGANLEAIRRAEDREEFRSTMAVINVAVPDSDVAHSLDEARAIASRLGFPLVVRPAFTLGGRGGGMVYNAEEFETAAARGLDASPITEILVEESVIGWKEFELEVMRDRADNVVIICSIENIDAMGVHTGDSITVAPAQTLSDREYQAMRDEAITIIRAIGVETGGSNIQFAVNPADGRRVAIEINPRVSRSSALASKATGFPIAKFAAKLAVGYTLDEIPNDITRETPASFEPAIDYIVVKAPRFAFEKFPGAVDTLGISMQSVGETMAIGRTFPEALQKALRGLETGLAGLDRAGERGLGKEELKAGLARPTPTRLFFVKRALKEGMPLEEVAEITRIDPWFLREIERIVLFEAEILARAGAPLSPELHHQAKRMGFSDRQLAELTGSDESAIHAARRAANLAPVHKLVDTCAAEFEAYTPYFYSTYERADENRAGGGRKILILGGGPNRIGQGIEFDYCCCHAAFAIRELGCEAIMVNSNPETVSTDYDTSDRLYFEPLTREDILAIIEAEKPDGVIVQLGGQTPLNLAVPLERAGVRILGTSPDAIDRASDRGRFKALVEKLGLAQPENGTAFTFEEARAVARAIRYPVIVRPSYVLGGRAMEIVYDEGQLERFMREALVASTADRKNPVLIDKFLEDAIEVDVDALADGARCVIGAIMEHIEEAGIHSGDSSCVIPPHTLSDDILDEIRRQTRALALELGVRGLMNVQYAVRGGTVYILEVNPRASRTVPFVSKAIGVPLVNIATKVMLGRRIEELGLADEVKIGHVAVKAPVFPFARFRGADAVLGPEMRSTGEVMGMDSSFGLAFAKALQGAGGRLPLEGNVFFSIRDADKRRALPVAKQFADLGFRLVATPGTAAMLRRNDIEVREIFKITGGRRPNIIDLIKNGEVQLIINTPSGKTPRQDEVHMRSTAVGRNIPLITTLAGAQATVQGIEALKRRGLQVRTLQEYTPPKMMQLVRAAGD